MSPEFSANLSLLTDHDIHSNKNSNTIMLAYTINMHFNSCSAGFAGITVATELIRQACMEHIIWAAKPTKSGDPKIVYIKVSFGG